MQPAVGCIKCTEWVRSTFRQGDSFPMKQGFALSTDGMNGREAAQAWHDWMAMLFAGIDSDIYGDTSFEGRVRVEHAGDVVMRLRATGSCARCKASRGRARIT